MERIKYYLSFMICIFILNSLYSQNDLNVKYGRINTKNGEKIKVKNLAFENNKFRYNNNQSSVVNYMSLDNILKVEKKRGTHALEFGLGLGVAGLLGSVIGSSNSSYNEHQQMNFIISYTSLCTIVGIIWGLTQGKYKTVYVNPQYGLLNIKSDYSLNPNSYALYRFKTYPQYK